MRPSYSPTEAAWLAHASVRQLHRLFDEAIVGAPWVQGGDERAFTLPAVAGAAVYFGLGDILTASFRQRLATEIVLRTAQLLERAAHGEGLPSKGLDMEAPGLDLRVQDSACSVDVAPLLRQVAARARQLDAARAQVSIDPEVMGGLPVVAGTRIPVEVIAASLADGADPAGVIVAWPGLTAEQVDAAALYASLHPRRGRPPARGPAAARRIVRRAAPLTLD